MRRAPQHAAGITTLSVNKPDPKVLQDFLAQKFALSRRTAKAMIDGRSVWVNRKCVWIARYELKTGDLVEVPSAVVKGAIAQGRSNGSEVKTPAVGAKRHVRVIWQNDDYLVADKPAGIVSCDDPKWPNPYCGFRRTYRPLRRCTGLIVILQDALCSPSVMRLLLRQ